jgi:hypothetical protein
MIVPHPVGAGAMDRYRDKSAKYAKVLSLGGEGKTEELALLFAVLSGYRLSVNHPLQNW